MIGDYLDAFTYDYLLKQGLADLPDTVDKRTGSVVYDAIAGTAKLLAQGYQQMKQIYTDTFAQYALGEPLQLRAIENGVKPKAAVKATLLLIQNALGLADVSKTSFLAKLITSHGQ